MCFFSIKLPSSTIICQPDTPQALTCFHARGTCQTYILGQRDGKAETYFVALDDTGHVINSGYQTCAEYDTDPQATK
nr:osmotically-inducible lipoprotein OsmE [Escherichia coli]